MTKNKNAPAEQDSEGAILFTAEELALLKVADDGTDRHFIPKHCFPEQAAADNAPAARPDCTK